MVVIHFVAICGVGFAGSVSICSNLWQSVATCSDLWRFGESFWVMAAAAALEVCGKAGIGIASGAQVVSLSLQSQFVSPQPSSVFVRTSKGSRRSSYGAGRARAVATRDPPRTTAAGGDNGSSNGAVNGRSNGAANGAATRARSMVSPQTL